ncbi:MULTISPECIES: DegT/DnrJ/EryC1/StrS family aminotransferase [unclassified Nocardioides]|uniref:DegT/DnrJ/EryC1/StrS family aminotransferase n=1 Tax=unclassified Nocardioides TaxID=2615069 RepID=UPI0006FBB26D|nr:MULTISPECIES: DegT/DnrJ/EryC1/StrS family aminotransferase [unclassified Nocardioides]KRA29945.1 aminotransferase DegT [Nocardioides sp. Root614]KRA86866.1 aminotransferase DegT [Nocardioides sp. Root682]
MSNPTPIPAARPVIDESDIEAVVAVMRSGMVVQGPQVKAFEEEFSAVVDGRHCVAVNSGTSALHLTLLALGFGPGDEVICPSFTFAATANAIRLVGATPVFADIQADTFNIDPAAIEALVGPKTVAIMPVHLYGLPADMTAINAIADKHKLAVVEDAAQAHLAAIDGRPVGSLGTAGCFSFYPTKNMHSLEGGMVTTADAELARQLRLLRNQGMEQRYANEVVGTNTRMTDVAAAVGRNQLRRLAGWTEQRRSNAATLTAGIKTADTPVVPEGYLHSYHQYTVRSGERDALQARLTEQGIGSATYYPTPVHRLKPFLTEAGVPDPRWELPETEKAALEALSLPVFPTLTAEELDRIVVAVNA